MLSLLSSAFAVLASTRLVSKRESNAELQRHVDEKLVALVKIFLCECHGSASSPRTGSRPVELFEDWLAALACAHDSCKRPDAAAKNAHNTARDGTYYIIILYIYIFLISVKKAWSVSFLCKQKQRIRDAKL